MLMYVKGVNEETGLCDEVGTGSDTEYYISQGFEQRDVEQAYNAQWYLVGKVPEKPLTVQDYDDAMESYIKEVRVARGYTTREPSDYKDDPQPRWAQDALDYIDFRSRVMTYGLEIQNKFIAGEEVPTLEEFKEHLKTITCEWTYNTPYV